MGNPLQRNQLGADNPFDVTSGNYGSTSNPNAGLISTIVGNPNPTTTPNTGVILGSPRSIDPETTSKLAPTPSAPGTILGGQMYDPTKPAPSEAVQSPVTAPATLPGYMQGESKEQRRERIRRNRLAKGEIT